MMIEQRAGEHELLARTVAGDAEAARQLLDSAGPVVYGFVYARVGGDEDAAEDLTQATFLEALRSARGFRGESALTTWLCAIARRQIARHYERERRRARLESKLHLLSSEPGVEQTDAPGIEDDEIMIAALGRLTPLHRQVLVMKYLDAMPVERIAGELGRSRVQIQSLLQRARASLRRELGSDDE